MKTSEFRKLIQEEARKALKEANANQMKTYEGTYRIVQDSNKNYSMSIPEMQASRDSSVGSVSDMLSSAKKSSATELVEIDTVPDFSGIMNKLKQQGQL